MVDPIVLFVDDEPEILEIIQDIFAARSIKVICTPSGRRAMDMTDDVDASVVVCDLILKDISGMEVLASWQDKRPETYRILTTGYLDAAAEKANREAGIFQQMIAKPWDVFELREAIESLVSDQQRSA